MMLNQSFVEDPALPDSLLPKLLSGELRETEAAKNHA